MKIKLKTLMSAAAVLCTALMYVPAVAQTAAKGSRVVGSGAGPILSREELRACFSQESSVKQRLAEHDSQRGAIETEKAAIEADKQSLQADRAPVDAAKAKVDDLSNRMKAFATKVQALNKDVADFGDGGAVGRQADAKRNQLNAERDTLQQERNQLEAEKTQLTADSAEAVKTFNAKAGGLQPRVTAWNQRNADWNSSGTALETDRQSWIDSCQARRYREDDEIAIKKGK
ncbi:MAG: hypothetical protein M3Y32_08175 [Pseudomonadota bacterium]|nr:hypothetical protein [Pseudomonadota bacterium]